MRALAAPLVRTLARAGVSANALTAAGVVLTLVAAVLVVREHWITAGIVFLAGSLADMLDGSVARMTGRANPAGAFLDSTFDRVSDGAMLGAIAVAFAHQGSDWGLYAALVAMLASLLVSYTRARAEGLGVTSADRGLMSRPERVIVLAIGVLLGNVDSVLAIIITVLAALSTLTVAQRVIHVSRELRERRAEEARDL